MDIKYFFKRLKEVDIKDVKKDAKRLGKKLDKSYVTILFDMALNSMKYGSSYKEYQELEFYKLNDSEKRTFITEKINNDIIDKYNYKEDRYKLNDKGAFNKCFKKYIKREFIDLRDVSFKEFSLFISDKDKIVCKDVNNERQEFIDIEKDKLKNEYNILKIYNSIMKKEEFIVEEYINEGKSALNHLRFTTFLSDSGEVIVLNSVLRIKNGTSDILEALVSDKGVVCSYALDKIGHTFIENPKSFERIKDYKFDNYEEIVKYVNKIAKVVPTIRYSSYDFLITKDDFYLISASANPKCFQINKKEGSLPYYKEHMKL